MVPGMMVNLAKPKAMELARRLLDWGEELGVQIRLPQREAHALGCQGDDLQTWCRTVDAAIVIGGDGTFLRAARRILDQGKDIPLFGINVGHLGFLATGAVEGAQSELTQILEGRYTVQKRHTLECRYIRGEEQKQYYALNDFVLYKGTQAKLISVAVEVHGRPMCVFRADGLIVATPTGSTAYALSAGGPIVPPHVPCMVLAPICAHTLYSRPIILAPHDQLSMRPRCEAQTFFSVDGQDGIGVSEGDSLQVSLSERRWVSVITLPQQGYFELLHRKLMWGFDPVGEMSDDA